MGFEGFFFKIQLTLKVDFSENSRHNIDLLEKISQLSKKRTNEHLLVFLV